MKEAERIGLDGGAGLATLKDGARPCCEGQDRRRAFVLHSSLTPAKMNKLGSLFTLTMRRVVSIVVLAVAATGAVYFLNRPDPEEWMPSAYYETQGASSSAYVSRPATEPEVTSALPDKILRRGTLVELVDPDAGNGWGKVLLADGMAAHVPLAELKFVLPENLPVSDTQDTQLK